MDAFSSFFEHHPLLVMAGCWILSAVAQSMPPPDDSSSKAYIWIHNLAQLIAANPKFLKFPNSMPKPKP